MKVKYKKVIIDKQTNITYKGKEFQFPMILLSILGILKRKSEQKWDNLILITGAVGTAKSTMAQGLAGVYEMLYGRELSLDNFTWSGQGVVDFIDREDNITEAIIYDEAVKGGTGRDVITKEGNLLKIGLVVGRRKRHLYFMLVDEIHEYSKKIISRASLLIDMRTMVVRGEDKRGYFKLYNTRELKDIYWLLKLQKIRSISEYSATGKPFYKFRNFEGIFIDEKEYEDKKIELTKSEISTSSIKWTEDKLKAFHLWSKTTKKLVDIADIVGINRSTMTPWGRDFKKYGERP